MNFALIAGGRSKRMADIGYKASIPWPPPEGVPLFQSQLAKLTNLAGGHDQGRVFISCQADQAQVLAGPAPLVFDSETDRGPLAGLAACLGEAEACRASFLTVLAVDLPLLPGRFLGELATEALANDAGVVPWLDGKWQPLAAVYPTALAGEAERRLKEGKLALQAFVDWAHEQQLIRRHDVADGERDYFQNLNTPADITVAAARLGSAGFTIEKHSIAEGWSRTDTHDEIAAEEPLEIRVEGRSVAVVMRTPGHDDELAAGFLLTEGVARRSEDFFEISQCPSVAESDDADADASRGNVIDVLLSGEARSRDADKLEQLTRHVFTSSSCGICGKATIDSVFQSFPALSDAENGSTLSGDLLLDLPNRLRRAQENFRRTGGLHASALFDTTSGELLLVREDIGRHNALDKVVGRALLDGMAPLSNAALLLSGRISFELMQKALAAGIPIVAGISAPSSLAVKFARESGQTLVGFLREKTFNVYAGEHRLS